MGQPTHDARVMQHVHLPRARDCGWALERALRPCRLGGCPISHVVKPSRVRKVLGQMQGSPLARVDTLPPAHPLEDSFLHRVVLMVVLTLGREDTDFAARFACLAHIAAVFNGSVAEVCPVLVRNALHEVLLDLVLLGALCQAQALRHATHMGVDGDPRRVEAVAEHHIRRFASHTRQLHELFHRCGDLAAVVLHERLGHALEGTRLVAVETRRSDGLLDFFERRLGQRAGIGEFTKESRRHLIDPLIGALRAQDCGHEEFVWRGEVQAAASMGIGACQKLIDAAATGNPIIAAASFPRAFARRLAFLFGLLAHDVDLTTTAEGDQSRAQILLMFAQKRFL